MKKFITEEGLKSMKEFTTKEIINIAKESISSIVESFKKHRNSELFKTVATKKIFNIATSEKITTENSVFDILEDIYKQSRLHLGFVNLERGCFVEGDPVILKKDNLTKTFIISNISNDMIKVTNNFNPEKIFEFNTSEFEESINIEKSLLMQPLAYTVGLCRENSINLKEDVIKAIEFFSSEIKDESMRERFVAKCIDNIFLNNATNMMDTILDTAHSVWNEMELNKATVNVGDKVFYTNSYVALKSQPREFNLIIKEIGEEHVLIEHKFSNEKFSKKLSHYEFYNEVLLFSDVFEEDRNTFKWNNELYNSNMFAMLLAEGVLRLNDEKGECFNIKHNPKVFINDIKMLLANRAITIDNAQTSEQYLLNCLQLLTNNGYSNTYCKNRSLIDTFDAVWDNMNIGNNSFIIEGKKYLEGEEICLKGYNGAKRFAIKSIKESSILLEAEHNGEIISKVYSSANDIKKNTWLVSDIKAMERKYINHMSELTFDKILNIEHVLSNMTCNLASKNDVAYINSLILKVSIEIKDRVELFTCLLKKKDYLDYITEYIVNSQIYSDIKDAVHNKSRVSSILKEKPLNHCELLGGICIGKVSSNDTHVIFEDYREFKHKFTYTQIYNNLIGAEFIETKTSVNLLENINVVDEDADAILDVKKEEVKLPKEKSSKTKTASKKSTTAKATKKAKSAREYSEEECFVIINDYLYNKDIVFESINLNKKTIATMKIKEMLSSKVKIEEGSICLDSSSKKVIFKSKKSEYSYSLTNIIKGLKDKQESNVQQCSFFELI